MRSKLPGGLLFVLILTTGIGCGTYQPEGEYGVWLNSRGEQVEEAPPQAKAPPHAHHDALPPPRLIEAGDELVLEIPLITNPTRDVLVVADDGSVSLPEVGATNLAGLSLAQARRHVAGVYDGYFDGVSTRLWLKSGRAPECSVLGQVGSPGIISLRGGATLSEVMARAGGFNYLERRDGLGASDLERAIVAREDGIVPVDFVQLFERGDRSHDIAILDGDLIFVPDNTHREVVVLGAVNKPGVVPMASGAINVLAAIGHAGGFAQYAEISKVAVVRNVTSEPRVKLLDLEFVLDAKNTDLMLENGDVIYVAQDDLAALDLPGLFKTAAGGVMLAYGIGHLGN